MTTTRKKTPLDYCNEALIAAEKRRNARYQWTVTFTRDIHPQLDGYQVVATADKIEEAQVMRAAQTHFGLTVSPLMDTQA